MALCSFPHDIFLKEDSYVFINTWNTEFYIPLSLTLKVLEVLYETFISFTQNETFVVLQETFFRFL